jgi:hypothetical protein
MIKQMIRIIILPIQSIFDAIRHQRNQRLMMSYILKINPKQNYCALRNEVPMKIVRTKQFNLARTAINGV